MYGPSTGAGILIVDMPSLSDGSTKQKCTLTDCVITRRTITPGTGIRRRRRGARIAACWADSRKAAHIAFKPDWIRHRKAAPFKRNATRCPKPFPPASSPSPARASSPISPTRPGSLASRWQFADEPAPAPAKAGEGTV
jgi:hypothetical protein